MDTLDWEDIQDKFKGYFYQSSHKKEVEVEVEADSG
jgi:hypothetical protein